MSKLIQKLMIYPSRLFPNQIISQSDKSLINFIDLSEQIKNSCCHLHTNTHTHTYTIRREKGTFKLRFHHLSRELPVVNAL